MTGPMSDIINFIRANRKIEAIKLFRAAFGGHLCGLKEAKDAVEAIDEAMQQPVQRPGEFIVTHKHENWSDHEVVQFNNALDAASFANRIVGDREQVYVARIVSKSVAKTTLTMQAVA
jgi:hypothetical protein